VSILKYKFKLKPPKDKHILIIIGVAMILLFSLFGLYRSNLQTSSLRNIIQNLNFNLTALNRERDSNKKEFQKVIADLESELEELKNTDQIARNTKLEASIEAIEKTYKDAVLTYENLIEFQIVNKNTRDLDKLFARALAQLSNRNYSEAAETLAEINNIIKEEEAKIATAFQIPKSVPESNSPPGSGYSRQSVNTDIGTYMVSMVAGDLGSTRVLVDTASDSDCSDNCPVLPLSAYISRTGAYAGINGSYFCPASYPSCAGKTNTFDLLVMNHKKTYFNSANNIYSNNPVVIFGEGYIRFIQAASGWGRDTSPTGVLSNYPLLISGGNIVFGGDGDPKKGSKGGRSFVAGKGNTVFIGVVHSATVAEAARVLKALGMENALNLDNGGSTALWSGGYKVGPGRDLPNVILFVKK
jgi:hypothetical protein